MAKRKEDPPKAGAAWMNTFSDLMNLLLCFFVLLFSMSTMDAQKFELVAASFSDSFSIFSSGATSFGEGILISNGVSQLNELDEYMNSMGQSADSDETDSVIDVTDEEQREQVEEQIREEQTKESEMLAELIEEVVKEEKLEKEVDIDFTSQYVELTLNGALLFDSGKADIKEDGNVLLDKLGIILEKYAKSTIEIEGHTDNVPIHNSSFKSNNDLSSARALSVFEYLIGHTSLNPAMVKHSGRGEYVPVADNSTPEGRTKNRRVEIKIYHDLSSYQ